MQLNSRSSGFSGRFWRARLLALTAIGMSATLSAQTCPFDDGNSIVTREGLVLTRYALGLTGAAMVNGTDFAATDAPTIASNIACPSCGLNITGNVDGGGNPVVTVADATIISRKLAGFSGTGLTNGVALGSGSRNTTSAVNSFLLSGCGTTPSNAWVNGGNSFGGSVSVIGTTDTNQMEVRSGGNAVKLLVNGENGLRILRAGELFDDDAVAVVNGSSNNSAGLTPNRGATVAGGGYDTFGCGDPTTGGTRSCGNFAMAFMATVGGGFANRATGTSSVISGGSANTTFNLAATIAGGSSNIASGQYSTIPGGYNNQTYGNLSMAAGRGATARGFASFVWSDASGVFESNFDPAQLGSFGATPSNTAPLNNTFIVRATGGVQFISGVNAIGSITSQCFIAPGGSGWNCVSDRNVKHSVRAVSPKSILQKLVGLPISTWSFNGNERRQIGPMSQDFSKAFRTLGVGDSETSINSVDAQGVAFAAIQGLNQIVKEKDAEIARLKADIAAIKKRLGM
jgi:hypothetical protein